MADEYGTPTTEEQLIATNALIVKAEEQLSQLLDTPTEQYQGQSGAGVQQHRYRRIVELEATLANLRKRRDKLIDAINGNQYYGLARFYR